VTYHRCDVWHSVLILVAVACAVGPRLEAFPRTAGSVAEPAACRVTGAWTLDGQSITPPAVTRCILPRYPGAMRSTGQEGDVLWRITVDSAGVPDSSSLKVIRTTSPELATAVSRAAPYLRFAASPHAAVIVELPTTFRLTK
jgi:TonB family protein